ncbi:MerR family transcriptional regulator [Pokkaliibacter plantistimulans]|uniref:MerR family transcriptional regulator n=1 Tax=Pokkaliibacter plantistimulans TaxID=1635171 RepID=A0ABX5LRW3_9GAMM|nr:MerR family transcriptional regulator [Pokkaliibacter plantistimulans]PXF28919.1 MerR family transcriptional regulator [Pokkaliibacter plantistimulans]
MNIQTFAEQCGVSAHTLRYYEKIGLLQVRRNRSGHRQFTERDRDWLGFISRLKQTGMPLQQICHYAQLRAEGDSTLAERQALLEQHAEAVAARIAQEQQHLLRLEEKIRYYQQLSAPAPARRK